MKQAWDEYKRVMIPRTKGDWIGCGITGSVLMLIWWMVTKGVG